MSLQTTSTRHTRHYHTTAATAREAVRTPAVPPSDNDAALMQQIALQDRHAFEQLYRRYAPRLASYLTRMLRQPELVDEVINDVMLVVWQRASDFQPQARVSTWLFGIAHRKALKAWQQTSRHPAEPLPDTVKSEGSEGNPESILLDQEEHGLLLRLLDHLPLEQRAVVELTYQQALSYQEIATIMGCPLNTVKTRLLRARRQLAAALAAML